MMMLLTQSVFAFDYFNERATRVNREWTEKQQDIDSVDVSKRVSHLMSGVDKYNCGKYVSNIEAFIDLYSIIEHETRWVNYRELDNGLSFGVASMRWITAAYLLEELGYNKPDYVLQSKTELQIRLAVYYYFKLLDQHNGNRNRAIVSYNRGPNFGREFYEYNYWQEVNKIRNKIKGEFDWNL